jgi:DNA-binding beta-propeller fold protein YncE
MAGRDLRFTGTMTIALLGLAFIGQTPAAAQIALSANDGKQIRAGDAVPGPFPDELVTLSLTPRGAHILGRVEAPATLSGPPTSVAMDVSGRFALVTSAQRLGSDNKLVPYGIVSLVSLADPRHPRILDKLELPAGAMGVSLTGDGRLALIACAQADVIAVVAVEQESKLKLVGTVPLEAKAEPRDVVVAPDGKAAYAVRFGDGRLTQLAIASMTVTRVRDLPVGPNPDGAIITADGHWLYNTNFGGTPFSGTDGAIAIVDLTAGKMTGGVTVGKAPEHVTLSPDGRYLAAIVGNGAAFTRTAANFATVFGSLELFRADGASLVPVAQADIGHNCQGVVFSRDGRQLLVQCAVEKSITLFHFDGQKLTRDAGEPLTFDARPGAIATAYSRDTRSSNSVMVSKHK